MFFPSLFVKCHIKKEVERKIPGFRYTSLFGTTVVLASIHVPHCRWMVDRLAGLRSFFLLKQWSPATCTLEL
jgi:hypothetical protein